MYLLVFSSIFNLYSTGIYLLICLYLHYLCQFSKFTCDLHYMYQVITCTTQASCTIPVFVCILHVFLPVHYITCVSSPLHTHSPPVELRQAVQSLCSVQDLGHVCEIASGALLRSSREIQL